MPSKEYFETLQGVIGTPEENRDILVKSILLDKKMTCTTCCASYQTAADMELMTIKLGWVSEPSGAVEVSPPATIDSLTDPSKLTVDLVCHCGHEGRIVLRPNPLIPGHSIKPYKGKK